MQPSKCHRFPLTKGVSAENHSDIFSLFTFFFNNAFKGYTTTKANCKYQ